MALPLVIAVLGGCSESTPTTPLPAKVASLSFVGAPPTGSVGVAANLTVQAKDAAGNVMPGQNITWTVSDWRVATTGPATGATWIKCAAEGATCAYTGAKLVRGSHVSDCLHGHGSIAGLMATGWV